MLGSRGRLSANLCVIGFNGLGGMGGEVGGDLGGQSSFCQVRPSRSRLVGRIRILKDGRVCPTISRIASTIKDHALHGVFMITRCGGRKGSYVDSCFGFTISENSEDGTRELRHMPFRSVTTK